MVPGNVSLRPFRHKGSAKSWRNLLAELAQSRRQGTNQTLKEEKKATLLHSEPVIETTLCKSQRNRVFNKIF